MKDLDLQVQYSHFTDEYNRPGYVTCSESPDKAGESPGLDPSS